METAQEFITSFHNVKGSTIGERHKNFFLLLKTLNSSDSATIDAITNSVLPQTYLESTFRVDFLIHFKRSRELFDVLKEGDERISAEIFKNPWFFQHPFDEMSASEIVNNLLPNLSFVSRNRMIRRLAKYNKDELKLGEVFDCLLKRYGIQTAKLILPGCTTDKIEAVLSKCDINLSPADLKLIFTKNPQVYQMYVKKNWRCVGQDKIIAEMILKEPDMFFELREKFDVDLGKRQTKRLLIHDKNSIITNSHSFKNMHPKTVSKFLRKNDRIAFLKNLFPEQLRSFYFQNIYKFLKHFPKFEQFQVYLEIFQIIYKTPLCDNLSYLDDCLLETIQNVDEREKWVELKIKQKGNQDAYVQYYNIDKAINLIQEKINSTKSEKIKCDMVKKLILTCKVNDDSVNLVKVLEYFHRRHNNATDGVKKTILSTLDSTFDLTRLNYEHWNIIYPLLRNFKVNDDRFKSDKTIYLNYILFLWKNEQPIKEKFIELFTNGDITYNDFEIVNGIRNDELVKHLVDIVIEITPYIENKNEDPYQNYLKCISWIRSWNSCHPSSKLSLFDYPEISCAAKKYIEQSFCGDSSYNWRLKSLFVDFICNKIQSDIKGAVINIYFKLALERYSSGTIVLWLLKNDPEALSKYTDNFVPHWCNQYFPPIIWDYIKKLSHYDFYNKTIKHCVEQFNKGSSRQVIVLAYLMQAEEFVTLVSKRVPATERFDLDNEDSKNSYGIYYDIAKSFKYTRSAAVLPTLGKFCVGDYLGSALESLYYLFYHCPENKLDDLLVELSTRAVSVRKHVYFLTSQVGTLEAMLKLLESAGRDEKNVSVKKHILNITLRYFRKNPSDRIFEFLKSCIPNLNITDTETLNSLVQLNEVPRKYQSKLFVFLLEYLRSRSQESHELNSFVDNFLQQMNEGIMKNIPPDFCISFIEKYFLQDNPYFSKNNVNDFVINYLMFCNDNPDKKVKFILDKLASYHKSGSNDAKNRILANRHINDIMDRLFCKIKQTETEANFMQNIFDLWLKLFSVEDFFLIYMKFRVGLLKRKSNDISVYAKNIYGFLEEICSQYGYDFIENIASTVQWWSDYCDKHYLLCFHLWEASQSVANCMLILQLISTEPPKEQTHCDRYYEILEALEGHQDKSIKILFNVFVKSLEC